MTYFDATNESMLNKLKTFIREWKEGEKEACIATLTIEDESTFEILKKYCQEQELSIAYNHPEVKIIGARRRAYQAVFNPQTKLFDGFRYTDWVYISYPPIIPQKTNYPWV